MIYTMTFSIVLIELIIPYINDPGTFNKMYRLCDAVYTLCKRYEEKKKIQFRRFMYDTELSDYRYKHGSYTTAYMDIYRYNIYKNNMLHEWQIYYYGEADKYYYINGVNILYIGPRDPYCYKLISFTPNHLHYFTYYKNNLRKDEFINLTTNKSRRTVYKDNIIQSIKMCKVYTRNTSRSVTDPELFLYFVQDGLYTVYNDGKIVSTTEYVNNKKNGKHIRYYPNGDIKYSCIYKDNHKQ
jgi:antitoxin component YwqK of YwqJK toxin-antitoxin module